MRDATLRTEELIAGRDRVSENERLEGQIAHGAVHHEQNYVGGTIALLLCLASWEAMGELVQDIQAGYKKPYFIVWILHNGYLFYIAFLIPLIQGIRHCKEQPPVRCSCKDIQHALLLNTLLLTSDYLWFLSLPRTVVAANSAMYQSMSVFVYIFSVLFLREKVSSLKNIGLTFCMAGMVTIIVGTSSSDGNGDAAGYMLCMGGVVMFSIYEVAFKYLRGHGGSIADTIMLTGWMGLLNLLIFWIPLLAWNYIGLEKFETPTNKEITKMTINAGLGATYTCSFLVGVAMTTPLFMSLGSVFIVPIGCVVDKLLHNIVLPWKFYLGVVLVIIGFCFTMEQVQKLICRQEKRLSHRSVNESADYRVLEASRSEGEADNPEEVAEDLRIRNL